LSPIDRATLEDEVMDWLEDHGIDAALAYPLTEGRVTAADLETATAGLDADRRAALVRYVAADATARSLAADVLSAGTRIHALVAAVKKHTHMDRAPTVEPIRLEEHLRDAITLMGSKAEEKGIALELAVESDVPMVMAAVADLNQVWIHLIDNAIDAAPPEGRIAIGASRGTDAVVITVVDDGPGIPVEDLERVFEPFFTTKDVNQGRGLGLDIVRTVVRTHRGAVDLDSEPGRTEFRVTLPAADTSG
jgi:signal transduction histidine kinase